MIQFLFCDYGIPIREKQRQTTTTKQTQCSKEDQQQRKTAERTSYSRGGERDIRTKMNPPNNNDNSDDETVMAAPAHIADVVDENLDAVALTANNNDDVEAAAAVENAAPAADLPFHAAAATNGDGEEDGVNLDPAGTEQICTEALTLLQNRLNLPSRLRDRTMVRYAQQFIYKVQEDDLGAAAVYCNTPAFPAPAAAAAGANEDEDEENEEAVVAGINNDDDAAANNVDDDDDEDDEAEDEDDDEDSDVDDVATLDVLDPAEREQICQEAMAILQTKLNLPSPLRDRLIVRLAAQQFINNVKDDIHKLLTNLDIKEEGYDGLDSERDTEQEVETAIRCDPDVLTRRDAYFGMLYPIRCLTTMRYNNDDKTSAFNLKAVAFVPLFARLAVEFHSFDETERGGLLVESPDGNNNLHNLVHSSNSSFDDPYHQRVDTTLLAVLIRLRQSGYLVHEDIEQYELVHTMCRLTYLSERRFRFMTEWCPSSLLRTDVQNRLPFHWGAHNIRKFRVLLEAYFRYYPKWKGLHALFSIDNDGNTPFTLACDQLTRAKVLEVVEESLVRYNTHESVDSNNALILAASDDTISLDSVYFIIRRQPDKMLTMLRHSRDDEEDEESRKRVSLLLSSNNSNNSTNPIANRKDNNQHNTDSIANDYHSTEDGHQNENHNKNDDASSDAGNESSNSNHNNGILLRSTRKRKRN